MLSADGRCKTWDARANGYVRSEGVGCTVVAPGGDGVVLLGLAVRQDGRSASLTAPNGSAQRTLLGAALAFAGVAAAGVARLEAHGTGTALGDPTEAGSLAATLCGRASGRASPLAVAAAKASIGHSEPASGQAGLQRLATALGRLAAGGNAQLRQLNPLVNERWKGAAAALSTQQVQAAVGGAGPVGGVSSFGYSGTIAHALLQSAPRVAASGVGGGAAVRFRRRAFTWATGAADARDSSAVALYSVGWAELAAAGAPTASSRGGQWLAVQPAGALGVAALSMLAAVPASVRLVSEPLGSACIGRSLRGVALLLDAADGVAPCVRGVQSAVRLAQLLCRTAPPPPLVLLTSGAVAVRCGAGAAALSGAAHGGSWGFARVLRLEQPAARVLSADVSRDACAAAAVGSLLSEAASSVVVGGAESEVAWAGGLRHGARLRRRGLEAATASGGTASGAWLVTGGLGGLGLRGAALLASRGASRLVLTSRSGLVARGGQGLEASLRAVGVSGGSTTVVACDGGDAAEAAALVALVRPTGVLHAAGLGDKGLIDGVQSWRLAAMLSPKALAAAYVHHTTSTTPLSAAVLYSSVASAFGNPGQANYAAGNACLDALARCRGAGGLAASCLQLPMVGGAGMGAAAFDERQMRYRGMAAISLEQYAACLGSVLARVVGVVGSPLPCGADQLRESVADPTQTRFVELMSPSAVAAPVAVAKVEGPLASALAALAASQRQPHVESLVVRVVRELTGSEASVTASTPLMEAGVDSLAATELSNRLRAATGLALSPTLVFEQPTPRAIAAHVLEQLAGAQPVVAPASLAAGSARAASGGTVCVRGAAGRWPGGCEGGAGALWPMLQASGDAVGAVPAARWTLSAVVDVGALSEVQAACVSHGGFVRDAERFDNAAFGVSAAESGAMDPQQRLLLETAYAALHASGARRSTLLGGEGGVFVGIERPDWALLASSRPSSVYAVTGDTTSVASGRLSFALGLQGPCVSVDTACSSALVALHGAWRAVLSGECPEGAASAVSLKLTPHPTLGAAAAGMLSADGRCKTWDARANGYVRSEGVGCTVVAPGVDGVVLLGLAVRQDGRSASLTAPNGSAQRTLLGAALAFAGVAAAGVARLEAHGTGTALGDPTEAGSLAATLCGRASGRASPLAVAAAKASIGHSEPVSGQAGLQRLATALGRLAAGGNAQLRQLNPLVNERWKDAAAALSTQQVQAAVWRRWSCWRRVVVRVQRHDCARAAAVRASRCCVGRGRRRGGPLPSARVHVGHWCGGCARQLGGRSVQRGLGGAGRGRRSHGVVAWRPVARGAARGRAGRCGAVDACGRACERAAGERAAWQRVHRALVARRGAAAGRGGRRGAVRAWRAVCGAPCAAAVPHGAAAAAGAADQRCCCGAVRCGRGCSVGRGARRQLGLRARAAPRAAGGACAERRRVARRVRCGGRGLAAFGGGIVGRRRRR